MMTPSGFSVLAPGTSSCMVSSFSVSLMTGLSDGLGMFSSSEGKSEWFWAGCWAGSAGLSAGISEAGFTSSSFSGSLRSGAIDKAGPCCSWVKSNVCFSCTGSAAASCTVSKPGAGSSALAGSWWCRASSAATAAAAPTAAACAIWKVSDFFSASFSLITWSNTSSFGSADNSLSSASLAASSADGVLVAALASSCSVAFRASSKVGLALASFWARNASAWADNASACLGVNKSWKVLSFSSWVCTTLALYSESSAERRTTSSSALEPNVTSVGVLSAFLSPKSTGPSISKGFCWVWFAAATMSSACETKLSVLVIGASSVAGSSSWRVRVMVWCCSSCGV